MIIFLSAFEFKKSVFWNKIKTAINVCTMINSIHKQRAFFHHKFQLNPTRKTKQNYDFSKSALTILIKFCNITSKNLIQNGSSAVGLTKTQLTNSCKINNFSNRLSQIVLISGKTKMNRPRLVRGWFKYLHGSSELQALF